MEDSRRYQQYFNSQTVHSFIDVSATDLYQNHFKCKNKNYILCRICKECRFFAFKVMLIQVWGRNGEYVKHVVFFFLFLYLK